MKPGHTIWRSESVWRKPAASEKRTIAKRPAGDVKKRPAGRVAGTSADTRSNGKWLWAAVTVGCGTQLYTHGNGLSRYTYRILPNKQDAKCGKPRGYDEVKDTILARVAKGSFLVHDKRLASVKAVKSIESLGYWHAPPVNHSSGWRDAATGRSGVGCGAR